MTELLVATGDELVRIGPQNDHWSATRLRQKRDPFK
jgi:hypothetical protein